MCTNLNWQADKVDKYMFILYDVSTKSSMYECCTFRDNGNSEQTNKINIHPRYHHNSALLLCLQ